ncbi:hypothetical protein HPB47_015993 [Ixodes persulcatus]|uniref:Uncharacterized protein n=1 Tax=Ixodes persulcatus TaxID=34615 RepID=A0AC60QRZ8_IXOPE|nr:hypothetical protein HPB47_015993 [Ixodes persulcatus]
MYLRLLELSIWPSRSVIDRTMPEGFKKKYPKTWVIIDATELKCKVPTFEAQLLKVVIDLHIQNGQLQQKNWELQVSVGQVLRHVVSFKHQGEQARPGEQATLQELARPKPPEMFLMPLSNMEQFRAAEARLKNVAFADAIRTALVRAPGAKAVALPPAPQPLPGALPPGPAAPPPGQEADIGGLLHDFLGNHMDLALFLGFSGGDNREPSGVLVSVYPVLCLFVNDRSAVGYLRTDGVHQLIAAVILTGGLHRRVYLHDSMGPAAASIATRPLPVKIDLTQRSSILPGTISRNGLGPLFRIERRLTCQSYCNILDHALLPYALDGLFRDEDFVLQQDLSPGADLNIIEQVWRRMKTAMARRPLHSATRDDLWRFVQKEWERLRNERDFVAQLYDSQPSMDESSNRNDEAEHVTALCSSAGAVRTATARIRRHTPHDFRFKTSGRLHSLLQRWSAAQLDELPKQRYRQKLTISGEEFPDPLDSAVLAHAFSTDARHWPRVEIGDIYVYLVEGTCIYTREQFKSYKLEDGYNLFLSGKLRKLRAFEATIESTVVVLVTGEVEASQTHGRYHQPWAVTKKEGTVLSAHCTCMAGLGEACSHVAVEVDVKFGMTDPSSTSVECRWITASSSAQAAPVAAIDFIKPSRKRQLKHAPTPKESSPVPEATAEQLQGFFKAVKEFAPSTLVLQSLSDSEDTDTAVSSDCGDDCDPVPTPGTVVNVECLYGSLDEPAGREATLTAAECNQVELCTRTQASSNEWFQQRRGRITASVMGKVRSCCTGAEGIVSEVMGYTKTPNVFSVRWGKDNEVKARNRFIADEAPKHKGFEVKMCGLLVDSERPYLGASPDGIVSCGCCDDAVQ